MIKKRCGEYYRIRRPIEGLIQTPHRQVVLKGQIPLGYFSGQVPCYCGFGNPCSVN